MRHRRTALLALALAAGALLLLAFLAGGPGGAPPPPVTASSAPPPPAVTEPAAAGPPAATAPTGAPDVRIAPPAREEPARFEGRVLSGDTGAGVAGAELTFSRGGAAASVRSAADGTFRFEPPAEGRWLLAAITAAGFFPFAPEWGHSPVQLDAVAGRQVRGIELRLAPATPLEGRVVDREGRPVGGAEIRLLAGSGEHALVPIPSRFVSDEEGAFRFAAPRGATLEARSPGFLPGRAVVDLPAVLAGRVTLELGPAHAALREPAPIAGRVLSEGGGPLAGALVTARLERGFGALAGPSAQAISGADGRFRLPALAAGSYRISAQAEGRAPGTARWVAAGAEDVVLELGAGGRLRGCVRDAASGAPVLAFTVLVLEPRTPLRLVPQRSRSVIDPSGCYALDDLVPGAAVVVISAPGHAPSPEQAVEIPPPPAEAVADATLERGGLLTGVVRSEESGAPIAGARLSVEGALAAASAFPTIPEAVTGADGTFALPGLPPRLSLHAAAAGHHARIVGGVEVPPGGRARPLEIRLRPAAEGEPPAVDMVGIGVVLAPRRDALTVASLVPGGGAAAAGLERGDVVTQVDGRPVAELGYAGTVDAIRGPEGTFVILRLRRGDETFEARVMRGMLRG